VQRQDAAEHAGNPNYISFDVGVRHLASRLLPRRGWRHGDPSVVDLADVTADEDATVLLYTYLESAQKLRWSAYVVVIEQQPPCAQRCVQAIGMAVRNYFGCDGFDGHDVHIRIVREVQTVWGDSRGEEGSQG
jgi:hypothetical protein